jgi:hypothetical protein
LYETKNESSRTKFELIVRIIVQIKIDEFVDSVQETEQQHGTTGSRSGSTAAVGEGG